MRITFRQLLNRLLRDRDINLTRLFKELNHIGIKITYPSLYSYYTGIAVPQFNIAKKIVEAENLSVDDSELELILEESRRVIKELKEEDEEILKFNIKIRPWTVDSKYSNNSTGLKDDIKVRINELYGKKDEIDYTTVDNLKKMSSYIAYLIRKDLLENNFIKEKEKLK